MPTPHHLRWNSSFSASERSPRAQGQRPSTRDTPAAQPNGLDPPGPTSQPSPQLSTAQAGSGHLVECLFWTPGNLPVVTSLPPFGHSTPTSPWPGSHAPVPTSMAQLLPHPAPQSQQSSPFSKWWPGLPSNCWLRQAVRAQEVSVRVVQDLRSGPHLSGNDVFDATGSRIHAQCSFKLV